MLQAELKLLLKGRPWWWYVITGGLIAAGLFVPLTALSALLPFSWLWPILIWSSMGVRELRYHTDSIIISAAYPRRRRLPMTWLAGLIVTMVTGSGVLIRQAATGNLPGVFTWTAAALFIPSLALALGVWSGGSSKLFEAVYMGVWYTSQQVPSMDFMGLSPQEAIAAGTPTVFLVFTIVLLGLASLGRKRQIQA